MRTVYQAENLIDAHLVKGRLENEGVPAWVLGDLLTGGMGQLPVSGFVAVCVADVDYPEAEAHLQRWEAERRQRPADATDDGALYGAEPDPA